MSRKREETVRLFEKGYNCAQALFAVYGQPFGVERELAFKAAGAFGGGMARRGEMCGALIGAMMVIGMKFGMVDPANQTAKETTYEKVHDMLARFRSRHGSLLCRDLLGADLGTPEGARKAREEKLSMRLCPAFIRDAAAILEKVLAGKVEK